MQAISYERARDVSAAVSAGQQAGVAFIGGGTNLLDLMKGGAASPRMLVDINHIDALKNITALPDGGIRIGALVRNSDAANHAWVRERYPLLSEAILAGASAQLRNMATMGGNVMQRTRCYYFYDIGFTHCNKRVPGSGCAAIEGNNRIHAILGASPQCIATNPSDMNVALAALDATIQVVGPQGTRAIAIEDFHRLPGDHPEIDTTLRPGELITSVDLPAPLFAQYAHYLKIRDRASYAFALVSVAVGLQMQGGVMSDARIALGGVAHKPWRARASEALLNGKSLSKDNVHAAAALAVQDAKSYSGNGFKVLLAQRAIVRAIGTAAQGGVV